MPKYTCSRLMCHTPWKKDIWKADYPEWQHRKLRGFSFPTHGRARLVIALIASTNCYSELSQHHYLQMEIWVWKHRFDMISWHVSAIEATFRLFPRQHKSLCSSYFIRNHGRNCCSHSTCKQILNPLTGPSKLWTSQQTSVKSGNYSKGQSVLEGSLVMFCCPLMQHALQKHRTVFQF